MFASWLRLFYVRRIAVPIGPDSLMLDVGCGEKPHWRADVLVDKYPDESHGKQRDTGGPVRALQPLFESQLEALPFADKAFDYVYCSHVLEHVLDPAAAVAELRRVGKSGYIEVPFVGIQKILDQDTHLWFCDLRDGVLTFEAKSRRDYDDDITAFLDRGAMRPFATIMKFYPDAAMIRLSWSETNPLQAEVRGKPNEILAHAGESQDSDHNARSAWPLMRALLRLLFFRKLRRRPISFNSIVKPEYRRAVDEFLDAKIYRVSAEA